MNNKLFLVASGKGGVGKSTVCANLGAALADMDARVLVVDADVTMRNLDLFFGLQDDIVFDMQDVLLGRISAEAAVCAVPDHENLFFLAAPIKLEVPATELYEKLFAFVQKQTENYDYILCDCPAGSGWLKSVKMPRCGILCVTTPDRTSLRDAEKLADLAALCGIEDVRLVLNRMRPQKKCGKMPMPTVSDVLEQVNVRLLGVLPEDSAVPLYGNAGMLVIDEDRRKISKAFDNIAERLTGEEIDLIKL